MSEHNEVVRAAADAAPVSKDAGDSLIANVGRTLATGRDFTNVGRGIRADLHDNATSGAVGSTTGYMTYPFKLNLGTVKLNSEKKAGEVLYSRAVDLTLAPSLLEIGRKFVQYKFDHFNFTITNISPFAQASGSIQVAYVNDPDNAVITGEEAVELVVRQSSSRQVKSKDTHNLDMNSNELNVPGAPSDWKFCLSRTPRIFSHYGNVIVTVRGVPALGDGAQFVISCSGTVSFYGMTINNPIIPITRLPFFTGFEKAPYPLTYPEEYGNYEATFTTPRPMDLFAPPDTNIQVDFAEPLDAEVTIVDASDIKVSFQTTLTVANCRLGSSEPYDLTYGVTLRSGRMSFLNRPYKMAEITIANSPFRDYALASYRPNFGRQLDPDASFGLIMCRTLLQARAQLNEARRVYEKSLTRK